jgi:transposase
MISEVGIGQIYLARGSTDLRKSIDGLAAIVQEQFHLDPFSPSLFVFYNRKRDKIKILQWDHCGFWLYCRRLERGRFQWPDVSCNSGPLEITRRELRWLLDGIPLRQKQAYPKVNVRKVLYQGTQRTNGYSASG